MNAEGIIIKSKTLSRSEVLNHSAWWGRWGQKTCASLAYNFKKFRDFLRTPEILKTLKKNPTLEKKINALYLDLLLSY